MDVRHPPEMLVAHATKVRGITIGDLNVAPVVVVSWRRRVVQALAAAAGAQLSPHWFYGDEHPLYTGEIEGSRVSFVHVPVGAAGTVMHMEELIVCGTRAFIGLGWAGSLPPSAPIGTLLIPTGCVREEGTSLYYVDEHAAVTSSRRLVDLLTGAAEAEGMAVTAGPVWTTDAPYRETVAKIETYGRQGVLGVDMETSAMYALGHVRGVETCNVLVVSDELWHEWRPAFGTEALRQATRQAQGVVLRCLRQLAHDR